jgi:hypothetical protein
MTDIVRRLREGRTDGTDLRWDVTDVHREAADEIERLHAALKVAYGYMPTVRDELYGQTDLTRALSIVRAALEQSVSPNAKKAPDPTKGVRG